MERERHSCKSALVVTASCSEDASLQQALQGFVRVEGELNAGKCREFLEEHLDPVCKKPDFLQDNEPQH